MESKKLLLSEENMFYTLQGEGKYAGYPSLFIRLSGCNLRCAWTNKDGTTTLCDTPHTSFEAKGKTTPIEEIKAAVLIYKPSVHIVITGGEPMLQKNLAELIDFLVERNHMVTIETNGTLYFPNKAQFFSISPKLANSSAHPTLGARHEAARKNFESLAQIILNHDYQFKFVYNSDSDIVEIEDMRVQLLGMTGIDISDKIWLMPQGITNGQFDEKAQHIWDICKNYGWKYTDRLHIRVYGQKIGV